MIFKDRVKQFTNTIGFDSYSLIGAFSGYRSFADMFSDGDVTSVCVSDGVDYEVIEGTISANGLSISRDSVFSSTNNGLKVDWSAGNKIIFCTLSAEFVMTYGHGDPAIDRNPKVIGVQYVDIDTNTMWFCSDNTYNYNVWDITSGISSAAAENIALALVIALG